MGKMNRPLLVVSFSLLVAALAFSGLQRRSTDKLQRDSKTLAGEQTKLDEQLLAVEERLATAQKKQFTSPAPFTAPKVPAVEVPPPRVAASDMARANDDPYVQILKQKAQRATLDATYGPLFRRWQLSPEKIAAFKDLILRRDQDSSDLRAALSTQGSTPPSPGTAALHRQIHTDYESAQRALLGESGYMELQEYERTSGARDAVSAIAGAAIVDGIPFSTETAEKLIHLIAINSPDYTKGQTVLLGTVDWEIVDAQAQIILSPEQFEIFTRVEPPGPNSAGVRGLPRLNMAITKAAESEKASRLSGG